MTYSAGQAAILAKVQTATGFTSANTSETDWKVLNSGASDHYAILRPGAFEADWRSLGGAYLLRYTTTIEVWQRYTDEGTTQANLFGHMAAAVAELVKWPTLGGIAEDVSIQSGGELQAMWQEGGNGPFYLMQELSVTWTEVNTVTYSE